VKNVTNIIFWITLSEPQSWLYSTPGTQEIAINYKNQEENKIIIRNTDKILL